MDSSLSKCDILTLYCLIDDAVKKTQESKSRIGRPSTLTDSEMITILVYNTLLLRQKNLKDILRFIKKYHENDFQKLPKYSAFIDHAHRILPIMAEILSSTMAISKVNFVDSTMLEVCTVKRVNKHKVAKNIAAFGKNHQGWHYGFKLHACINPNGIFSSFAFSPANMHDAQMLPKIIRKYMKIIVGDSTYGASVMRNSIWKKFKTFIIAPPHWKQKSKIATLWQNSLLNMRAKIESVYDILKQHFHLVSSFPRSIIGYFVHYIRILLAYQFSLLLKYADLRAI